ncbi:hypothetical protein [Fulvivirga ligni]|uniref:hypothetical protein n=1 Tax=Fulvivirga ligni TaxID=2904246 RepID=UPI001F368960|nr:hypothetical protein [Fulvivirga ligni]UII20824.1 hypothetical protein LVD16_23570 [Fulvivirga ligni]
MIKNFLNHTICVCWLALLCSCNTNHSDLQPEYPGEGGIQASKISPSHFRVAANDIISLKGSNGLFVSSENGTGAMYCDREAANNWEKFTVIDQGNGRVALKSMGKYLSSENGQQSMKCDRNSIQGWELFTIIENADGTISIQGSNGKYVSSGNGENPMMCDRDIIQAWEKFTVVNHNGNPDDNDGWNLANLTNYTSYPDPGSDECIYYNGCQWAGYFAFIDGKMTEAWVMNHNIIAIHSKDADQYKLKTFRLRQGNHQIDAMVYDMCADSDCDGCCTQNSSETGFLIDIEKYTMERFGSGSGIVEWQCLDCE